MINTYNETELHAHLKNLYARLYNGKTEQTVETYICDIKAPDNLVIEIQTSNLRKILPKILDLLHSYRVILVYPLPVHKYIEYIGTDGLTVSRKKSPKKQSIHDIFEQLMGIYPLAENKNFTLEVLLTIQTEKRRKTETAVQSQNMRRRRLKNWIKTGKSLDEIIEIKKFNSVQDYSCLLPPGLPSPFTAKDIASAGLKKHAYKMIWVLNKMEALVLEGKKGKSNSYSLVKQTEQSKIN